jgi:hypothetical protein
MIFGVKFTLEKNKKINRKWKETRIYYQNDVFYHFFSSKYYSYLEKGRPIFLHNNPEKISKEGC